jgi:hypothetical protein
MSQQFRSIELICCVSLFNTIGRNFQLTDKMSVIIGVPCTNVVVKSDTELVATLADSSQFGDPKYLVRPKIPVIIADARGRTDYRTVLTTQL